MTEHDPLQPCCVDVHRTCSKNYFLKQKRQCGCTRGTHRSPKKKKTLLKTIHDLFSIKLKCNANFFCECFSSFLPNTKNYAI